MLGALVLGLCIESFGDTGSYLVEAAAVRAAETASLDSVPRQLSSAGCAGIPGAVSRELSSS